MFIICDMFCYNAGSGKSGCNKNGARLTAKQRVDGV